MRTLPLHDEQLVQAAQAGDRTALGLLVQRHRLMALGLCRRLLQDDALAEDAVQEASLEALLHITRLRKPGRFGAWLAGIALNICRSWLRERAHESWSWEAMLGGQHLPGLSSADPEDIAIETDLAHRVHAAVAQLPPSQRDAVTLFYLSGFTYQEMTTALGIRLGAVKARLNKGRKALRTKLLEELEGIGLTTEQEAHPIAMRVVDVRRSKATSEEKELFCVLLQEVDGERLLPIWIGPHEGTAIAKITRPGGQSLEVDARPSDVINLALLTGTPLLVDPSVVQVAAQSDRSLARQRLTDENSSGAAAIAQEAKATWSSPMRK